MKKMMILNQLVEWFSPFSREEISSSLEVLERHNIPQLELKVIVEEYCERHSVSYTQVPLKVIVELHVAKLK
jgi:hypothetical protein